MEVLELGPVALSAEQRQTLFDDLYETAFPPVARFVSKMGGGFDDARDVFQDALVVFYEKHDDASFTIQVTPEAYVLGIAKHLWLRKFNKPHKEVSLDETEAAISLPDNFYPTVNEQRLLTLIGQTGKQCLNLLRAFYYEKLPVKQIAKALGFRSEHSASVQKYKCIEKIRATIKQHTISYEDFID